jgi:predicted RNase H-like nuclease
MTAVRDQVVVGIDACRTGWFAVVLQGDSASGMHLDDLDELRAHVPEAAGVAIDIPLTLPTRGRREADVLAKGLMGRRHPVVFFTPPLAALEASDHATASQINRELTSHGLSQQAFALRTKILEAREWLPRAHAPVWEAHPEVSFAAMTGTPILFPKQTWAGARLRAKALANEGIVIRDDDPEAANIAADDVLDAAAAAWTARRCLTGHAISLPEAPGRADRRGVVPAIFA